MSKELEYIGEHFGYQIYRNSEGFLEGWRSVGLVNVQAFCRPANDLKRVVTNTKKLSEFEKFVMKYEIKPKKYDPYADENQIKINL